MKNGEIYLHDQELKIFQHCDITIPVRINFYLQKNIQMIKQAAMEIEIARLKIGAEFGTPTQEGNGYIISEEHMSVAQQELNDLFALEQDLNIHVFKLSDFDGIELTYQQMSAIMFMVEED